MKRTAIITEIEQSHMKKEIPEFHVGDTVNVHQRIIEGDKERTQVFTGTVIGRSGTGVSETFSLHRISYKQGMERIFMLHSPRITKIEVTREGKVRRAKLYHLRGAMGKAAKVKSRVTSRSAKKKAQEAAKAAN